MYRYVPHPRVILSYVNLCNFCYLPPTPLFGLPLPTGLIFGGSSLLSYMLITLNTVPNKRL